MANPTTNLEIVLPVPGSESSRGSWGGTINDAVQSLDTAIEERSVPSGGTDDQILTKNGTTDYATEWATRLSSVGITGTDGIEVDSGSPVTTAGSITLGINKTTLLSFLNAEDAATADQTASEIKTLYESNSDTNEFSDAEQTKLSGIETSATADQTGAQIKTAYQAETNAFTDAQFTKLAGIETSATADQTGAQIKTLYQAETNAFTDAQFTKLAGIEASADVTDATNVNAAGAFFHTDIPDSDTGFIKRTGSETYDIDTTTYLSANQTITASGDATGSGTTSIALTLAASGVSAGSYGSATAIPVITFDVKGRATSASTASFSGASIDDVTALSIALG